MGRPSRRARALSARPCALGAPARSRRARAAGVWRVDRL